MRRPYRPSGRKPHDLTGQRFSRLVAQWPAGYQGKNIVWLCLCDCGTLHLATTNQLTRDNTKSCGCLHSEVTTSRSFKHGHAPRGNHSPTYLSWRGMVERCTNPSHEGWQYYGAQGVKVCDRWRDFTEFLADMGKRPVGTTIDRFPDKNGNYEPGNCRWATATEQVHNRRPRKDSRTVTA